MWRNSGGMGIDLFMVCNGQEIVVYSRFVQFLNLFKRNQIYTLKSKVQYLIRFFKT